jgi:hypothetical protein
MEANWVIHPVCDTHQRPTRMKVVKDVNKRMQLWKTKLNSRWNMSEFNQRQIVLSRQEGSVCLEF